LGGDADDKSAEAVGANPYAEETECSVDARGHDVQPVLHQDGRRQRRRDSAVRAPVHAGQNGRPKASCVKPLATTELGAAKDKDDDDDDMPDQAEILKRMQRGEPMQN